MARKSNIRSILGFGRRISNLLGGEHIFVNLLKRRALKLGGVGRVKIWGWRGWHELCFKKGVKIGLTGVQKMNMENGAGQRLFGFVWHL